MESTDVFRQDVLTTAQYWDTFARGRDVDPEKRLLAAVLEDAVESYRALGIAGGRQFSEDEAWLFSDDKRYAFSFRNICEVLGLSATRIRRSLKSEPAAAQAEKPRRLPRRTTHGRVKTTAVRESGRRRQAGFTLAP